MRYFGNEEELEVSDKHLVLRIVLFCIVFVIAVTAFSKAVVGIGYKEPGYYDIETNTVEDALLYNKGITFTHYFDGKSDDIKKELLAAKDAYSEVLSRAYKLLDPENTYDGFVNIAYLNAHRGENVEISDELFAILTDAYDKTREKSGYNMFAGAVHSAWNSILVLDEPEDFDPENNPDEAARISGIAEMTAELDNFSFTVVDADRHIVRFDVSAEYLAYLAQCEAEPVILDLNVLHDAYMVSMVRDTMEEKGFNRGYITCGGITVSLSKHEAGAYCLYAKDEDGITTAASVPVTAGSVCSERRSFAFTDNELGYYKIENGGRTYYRHPNFAVDTGEFTDVLMTSYVISAAGNIVDACYYNAVMNAMPDMYSAAKLAGDHHDFIIAYTIQTGDKVVFTNAPNAITLEDDKYTINTNI